MSEKTPKLENQLTKNCTEKQFKKTLDTLLTYQLKADLSLEDMQYLLHDVVQPLFGCEGIIAGIGEVDVQRIYIGAFTTVSYPDVFVEQLAKVTSVDERYLMGVWLDTNQPLWIPSADADITMSESERQEMKTFGLCPMLIHGQRDLAGRLTSYFSFRQCQADKEDALRWITLLMPFLHVLLVKALEWQRPQVLTHDVKLSSSEWELIELLKQGYANKEIANQLDKSASTIKNQLNTLMEKLDVSSRSKLLSKLNEMSEVGVKNA